MTTFRRAIAAAELLMVLPAVLFFSSLFVRNLTPVQIEPAHTAQAIVAWYTHLPVAVGLWALLMGLPFAVFALGAATLVAAWRADERLRDAARMGLIALRAHFAIVVIALATTTAGAALVFVAVHALTD